MLLYSSGLQGARVVRIFSNFLISKEHWENFISFYMTYRDPGNLEIYANTSGPADLVIVFDTNDRIFWSRVPKNRVVKVCREPVIRSFWTHRFTYHHERHFSHLVSREPGNWRGKLIDFTPVITGVSFPIPTLSEELIRNKVNLVSIIASTLDQLPGHRERNKVITSLSQNLPELKGHVFGRGREVELESKLDGLLSYKYSLAIENSSQKSYVTEKFTDCILSGVVPVYWGAPNISEFFPIDSYVQLDSLDPKHAAEIFGQLSMSEYQRRIQAVRKSRALIVEDYNVISLIYKILDGKEVPLKAGFVMLFGLDSALSWLRRTGAMLVALLPNGAARIVRQATSTYLKRMYEKGQR